MRFMGKPTKQNMRPLVTGYSQPPPGNPVETGEPSLSAELEAMEKNVNLLADSLERAVLKAQPFLKGDPASSVVGTPCLKDAQNHSSAIQLRLNTINERLYNQFVILQNFGSYLDT